MSREYTFNTVSFNAEKLAQVSTKLIIWKARYTPFSFQPLLPPPPRSRVFLATLGSANGAGAAGCGAMGCAKRVAAVGVLGATAPSDAEGGRDAAMLAAGAAGGGFVAVGVFGPDAPPELLRRIGAGGAQGVGRGGCGACVPQGVTREYMLPMLTCLYTNNALMHHLNLPVASMCEPLRLKPL